MRQSVLLITTTDAAGGRGEALSCMLASVERSRAAMGDVSLTLALLVQRGEDPAAPSLAADLPPWVSVTTIAGRVSLAKARNLLLEQVLSQDLLGPDTIVAFPDDDCWYPDDLLSRIVARVRADPMLDFWFCRYGSSPEPAPALVDLSGRVPSLFTVAAKASSNTMVFRGAVVKKVGRFDERLGVGALYNGGEDTAFALAAAQHCRGIRFVDRVLVGHRDSNPALRVRYYPGTYLAIRDYGGRSLEARLVWLRKIAVGASFVAMGRLAPQALIGTLGTTAPSRSPVLTVHAVPDGT